MNSYQAETTDIDLTSIAKVHKTITPYILKTPLILSKYYSELLGKKIYLKLENLQTTGTFKSRGAVNKALKLLKSKQKFNGIITASGGGNHAIAVAYAGKKLGIKTVIVMPEGISEGKVNACKNYGATVFSHGEDFRKAYEMSLDLMKIHDLSYIHPFDDMDIVSGTATIALEIFKDLPQLGTIVCSIGGGGLISGVASTIKKIKEDVRVFGVETVGADSMFQSFKKGEVVELSKITSFAEGLTVPKVSELTFKLTQRFVDDIFTVSDEKTKEQVLLLFEKQKLVVEPAAACTLAAIVENKIPIGENTVVILSGGNLDLSKLKTYI